MVMTLIHAFGTEEKIVDYTKLGRDDFFKKYPDETEKSYKYKGKVLWSEVKRLLPTTTYLHSADREETLLGVPSVITDIIRRRELYPLEDAMVDEHSEACMDTIRDIIGETETIVAERLQVNEYTATRIVHEVDDQLTEYLHSVDKSNYFKEVVRNTGKLTFFYDTGVTLPAFIYGNGVDYAPQVRLSRMKVKRTLGIKDSKYDSTIDLMVEQSTYGGNLVVYFRTEIEKIATLGMPLFTPNCIAFENAYVAIVDMGNGSGDFCQLHGYSFALPFKRDNLFYEGDVKPSFVNDVCGLVQSWCDDTKYSFVHLDITTETVESSINAHMNRQRAYDKTYAEGKCTAGDMKMSRHRSVEYINHYPCGNRCKDCGTFWVD